MSEYDYTRKLMKEKEMSKDDVIKLFIKQYIESVTDGQVQAFQRNELFDDEDAGKDTDASEEDDDEKEKDQSNTQ